MHRSNRQKRDHTRGPHILYIGHHQQVMCLIIDWNTAQLVLFLHLLHIPWCQVLGIIIDNIHIVLSTPVKVKKLDFTICVKKNIWQSQVTKTYPLWCRYFKTSLTCEQASCGGSDEASM